MSLCEYKDILGEPRKGFHSARIPWLDLALNDVLGTGLIIVALYYITDIGLGWLILITIVVTVLIHKLFCVQTKFNIFLGL